MCQKVHCNIKNITLTQTRLSLTEYHTTANEHGLSNKCWGRVGVFAIGTNKRWVSNKCRVICQAFKKCLGCLL